MSKNTKDVEVVDEGFGVPPVEPNAIPSGPFYLSQANTEFGGDGYASNILIRAGVPVPALLSALMGRSSASHQFTIGARGNGWIGFQDVSGVPPYGQIVPRDVGGFPSVTEVVMRNDNLAWSWASVYGQGNGTMRLEIPGVTSCDFHFNYDSESSSASGDLTGVYNHLLARVGQTIGVNLRSV